MTWHKDGKWYNPGKMVHLSDAEAWTYFNDKHRDKAAEARNVRVALATDRFNPIGTHVGLFLLSPSISLPASPFNGITYSYL
jgi:hypothetical protein